MSNDKRVRRPVEDIPVLTEEVSAVQGVGGLTPAQVDALAAEIERSVLEDLTPRLEDAVHEAVRSALERALDPKRARTKTP